MNLAEKTVLFYYRIRLNSIAFFSAQHAAIKALQLFSTPRKRTIVTEGNIMRAAQLSEVISNGFNIQCYRWNSGAGKRILLVHGFESAAGNFQHFVQGLTDKGYEVVAFDAQAHGKSNGVTITLPEFVANIQSVYNAYGPFNACISHSFGGLALTHFCEKQPQAATRLVLIAPATESVSAIDRFFTMLQLNKKIRYFFDRLVEKKAGVKAEILSIKRAVTSITCPILWIHDRQDPITPFSDAQNVQNEQHTNIQFIITEGLGHRRIYRDPAVIQQILHFV